jgi:DNA-binding NarL/FixJ family response regulator
VDIGDDLTTIARIVQQERGVATLVALGLSDAEIARRMAIAEGTIADHTRDAVRRLERRARARIMAWAAEHGL